VPQTKSAKKALKKSLRNRRQNLYYLKKIRLLRKQIRQALAKKKKKDATESLKLFYKYVDKAVKEKVFHRNKGSRLKKRISIWLNTSLNQKKKTTKKQNSK